MMQQTIPVKKHMPRNVNMVHEAEIVAAGFNTRLAVWLTEHVGTMWTAYVFAILATIGLFGILNLLPGVVALLVAWISQTFIQLVLLPIIMVGQNVLGRKSELQADEAYATTMKTYADTEGMIKRLNDLDEKIYTLETLIKEQTDAILSIVQSLKEETQQR